MLQSAQFGAQSEPWTALCRALVFRTTESACANSPRYQGETVVRRSGHFAAFSSGLQHLGPQRRTVHGDFPNGDDQLTVQSDKRIEFLDDLC